MSQKDNAYPLLVIAGETASGKSKVALDISERLDTEIICADSWTVRQGLDIGTDKPTLRQQAKVRHHLLDVVEPCQDFTAAVFKQLASEAIVDIGKRGKLAIMVGGSGLYIDSVIFNYQFLKAGDKERRAELNALSVGELLAEIESMGLAVYEGLDTRNKRRLIRFIESEGVVPGRSNLRPNTLIIGLKTEPSKLRSLIDSRVDQMIVNGLEKEVGRLSQKYGWDCEGLKGVGYKQWREYFEGGQSLEETRNQIVSSTLNLAKKQRTWFKRNKSIHWLSQPVNLDDIVDRLTTKLSA